MKFVSKQKEFRLIIRPTEVILDEARRPRIMQGERVEFRGGVFFTEDPGLITYLLHHKLYGLKFTSECGNDPVKIEKACMVFDDGAELSKPKIVAGYPERNRPKDVEMVHGAISTQTNSPKAEKPSIPKGETALSREETEALIDSKLDSFIGKIELLLKPQTKVESRPEPIIKKSRKGFSCPYCGEMFNSGFAVGSHKKACPNKPTE